MIEARTRIQRFARGTAPTDEQLAARGTPSIGFAYDTFTFSGLDIENRDKPALIREIPDKDTGKPTAFTWQHVTRVGPEMGPHGKGPTPVIPAVMEARLPRGECILNLSEYDSAYDLRKFMNLYFTDEEILRRPKHLAHHGWIVERCRQLGCEPMAIYEHPLHLDVYPEDVESVARADALAHIMTGDTPWVLTSVRGIGGELMNCLSRILARYDSMRKAFPDGEAPRLAIMQSPMPNFTLRDLDEYTDECHAVRAALGTVGGAALQWIDGWTGEDRADFGIVAEHDAEYARVFGGAV